MKKFIAIILIIIAFSSISVSAAVPEQSFLCTVCEGDISGSNYQIYFMSCNGHYDYEKDEVTIYITNTSKNAIDFQVTVGYSGSEQNPTTVELGYVKLEPYVTGKFVLKNLYDFPEKSDVDRGITDSHLGANSVVRVQARNIKVGDTFIVCGMNRYGSMRDSNYTNMEPNSVISRPTVYEYINSARLVIKKEVEEEEKEETGYTLEQPPTEVVNKFITITVASAIICVGGLIIYTFVFIVKRRENDD